MIKIQDKINYQAIKNQMYEITDDFLDRKTKDIQNYIKSETPEKTGKLVSLIRIGDTIHEENSSKKSVYVDLNEVPYAGFVEDGNGKELQYHKPAGTNKWKKTADGRQMFGSAYTKYKLELGAIISLNK